MSKYEIVDDEDQRDRAFTWSYLNGLLPHGGMMQMLPLKKELASFGFKSALLRAQHQGETVGAVFIGPSYEEYADAMGNEQENLARTIVTRVRSLHGIAVAPGHRGQGIGSLLLRAGEESVSVGAASLIIGVAHGAPQLAGFYAAHGYRVGEGARPLLLKEANEYAIFPQDDPTARWIYKDLPREEPSSPRPIRALHPTDSQLHMVRASAGLI